MACLSATDTKQDRESIRDSMNMSRAWSKPAVAAFDEQTCAIVARVTHMGANPTRRRAAGHACKHLPMPRIVKRTCFAALQSMSRS